MDGIKPLNHFAKRCSNTSSPGQATEDSTSSVLGNPEAEARLRSKTYRRSLSAAPFGHSSAGSGVTDYNHKLLRHSKASGEGIGRREKEGGEEEEKEEEFLVGSANKFAESFRRNSAAFLQTVEDDEDEDCDFVIRSRSTDTRRFSAPVFVDDFGSGMHNSSNSNKTIIKTEGKIPWVLTEVNQSQHRKCVQDGQKSAGDELPEREGVEKREKGIFGEQENAQQHEAATDYVSGDTSNGEEETKASTAINMFGNLGTPVAPLPSDYNNASFRYRHKMGEGDSNDVLMMEKGYKSNEAMQGQSPFSEFSLPRSKLYSSNSQSFCGFPSTRLYEDDDEIMEEAETYSNLPHSGPSNASPYTAQLSQTKTTGGSLLRSNSNGSSGSSTTLGRFRSLSRGAPGFKKTCYGASNMTFHGTSSVAFGSSSTLSAALASGSSKQGVLPRRNGSQGGGFGSARRSSSVGSVNIINDSQLVRGSSRIRRKSEDNHDEHCESGFMALDESHASYRSGSNRSLSFPSSCESPSMNSMENKKSLLKQQEDLTVSITEGGKSTLRASMRSASASLTTTSGSLTTSAMCQEISARILTGHQCLLPTLSTKRNTRGGKFISGETLTKVMDGEYDKKISQLYIIDCRYPYEFNGGHIRGALNLYRDEEVTRKFLSEPIIRDLPICIVFHCEFSSKRGPKMYQHLRSLDRSLHLHCYPDLYYPETYVLEGGYKDFYGKFKKYCSPEGYTLMTDERYQKEYRECIAPLRKDWKRSKSWSEACLIPKK
eukprot:Nk52_evm5s2340 gene=Nk52_evmTU5s2340